MEKNQALIGGVETKQTEAHGAQRFPGMKAIHDRLDELVDTVICLDDNMKGIAKSIARLADWFEQGGFRNQLAGAVRDGLTRNDITVAIEELKEVAVCRYDLEEVVEAIESLADAIREKQANPEADLTGGGRS